MPKPDSNDIIIHTTLFASWQKSIPPLLEATGLLEKTESHTLMIPRGDRSGAIVEPYRTDQWYVKIDPLAKPAIEAVESGKTKIIPDKGNNANPRTYRLKGIIR